MSILDKLWDDTVAGPRPDSGLGKLRKYNTFNLGASSGKETEDSSKEVGNKVTRSIMIVKPGNLNQNRDSPPVSPAGSTPPVSPFAGAGGSREAFRFRRGSGSFKYENAGGIGPRSPPPPYDM